MVTSSINTIPMDIVLQIFARLLVKSLMRLRLISKSFFSITADTHFITSHLALSRSIRYASFPSQFDNDLLCCITIHDKSFLEVLRLEIPFSFSDGLVLNPEYGVERNLSLVSSCRGLLCITDDRLGCLGPFVVLWNPMIRKLKSITDTSLNADIFRDIRTMISLGLGYDDETNDQKIIRIVVSNGKNGLSREAEMYSLKADLWRQINFPASLGKIFIFAHGYSFCDGTVYWIAYESREANHLEMVILSFNINDEKFKVIRFPPNYARGAENFFVRPTVLNESLALCIVYEALDDEGKMCGVWKMDNHEEFESWTEQILPITPVVDCYGYTEDGEFVLAQDHHRVSLYNLETGALKETNVGYVEYIFPFRESLVLL